ncbi:antitoxin VapB family protein [Halegenticoccus tardaugens]|uniref:antitoxin VapB family protein n=1 Tax=Halegenticoccus tardaugens TaxID=2071624 RepID=UPI00100AEFAA|nr:antitoxin VapB family protein [Halegenticoccus tardaugens]
MGAADEQIRVSEAVKREIKRRRREGESYNDVLERLFGTDRDRGRDLLAGAGFWSSEKADRVRETRRKYKEKSKERIEQRGGR